MLFYALVILCVVLKIVSVYKNGNYWQKRNIKYVNGTLWKFLFGKQSLAEVYKQIYDDHPNESYVGAYLGRTPTLIIKNLEDIQAVLASDFQSFNSRGIILNNNDVLADSVLFMDNFNRWKLMRSKLSPTFTSSRLKNLFCIFDQCARDFAKFVEDNKHVTEKPFKTLYTYTTASIGASVFGIDIGSGNTMNSPFLEMAWNILNPSLKINLSFFLSSTVPNLFQWLNISIFGEHEKFFLGFVKNVLNHRRNDSETRNDFIDLCLTLQKQGVLKDVTTGYELEPTDEVIAAQAFFFFIAGADTSANTMHFTLLELASNQKILAKVHEEIDKVLDGKDELTYTDVESLQYLDMVVNEAMRKYPTIGLLQRKCTRDTTLPGGAKIEKDTLVIVPTFAVHRDEKYYPNPDLFDPERFSHNNASKIPKFSFMGFGEGNRICIGARLARLQVKAGLAWLLRKFTLGEQNYKPEKFEPSNFSLRDPDATYELIPRLL